MQNAQFHNPQEFSTGRLLLGPLTATGSAQNGGLVDTTGYEGLICDVSVNITGTISAGAVSLVFQETSDPAGSSPAPTNVVHQGSTITQSGTLNIFTGAITGDALGNSGVYSGGTIQASGGTVAPTAMLSVPMDMALTKVGKYIRPVVTVTQTGGTLGEVVATLRMNGPSVLPAV